MKSKRQVKNISRLSQKRKKAKSGIVLFSLMGLLGLLIWTSNQDNFFINTVRVSGNQLVSTEEVRVLVDQILAEKYLWVIPKKNIFLYPAGLLEQELMSNFPKLASVQLSYLDLNSLSVKLTEREINLVWCLSGRDCYFIDKDGFVFSLSPRFSDTIFFEFQVEKDLLEEYIEEGKDPIGQYILTRSAINEILLFKDFLSELRVSLIRVNINAEGDYNFEDRSGTHLVINKDNEIKNTLLNLESVIDSDVFLDKGSSFREKLSSLRYIDLRFGKKIYYEFK